MQSTAGHRNIPSALTLILLTWTIWRAPTNASKWRMGFNSAFKGLIRHGKTVDNLGVAELQRPSSMQLPQVTVTLVSALN